MLYRSFTEALATGQVWDVLYADPPWGYNRKALNLNAGDVYQTLTLPELKALPVGQLAADDCALLMWTTDSHLEWALELGKAWGFKYATVAFYWHKVLPSGKEATTTGPWVVKSVEQCLLFTKGKVNSKLLTTAKVRSFIEAERGQKGHSAKPLEARRRVERMFGFSTLLELFAREEYPGWDSLGNEL
jgi:N6-adenosine-specific RNA methylase IME4